MVDVAGNLRRVQDRIAAAARCAGRNPNEITLVAVTKNVPLETILRARRLGIAHFGENRVQEAREKFGAAALPDITLHMVGHLQKNKARLAAQLFDFVHSVDSVELAELLSREGGRAAKTLPVLVDVNVSGEPTKFGLPPAVVGAALGRIASLPNLRVLGLMTIAPLVPDRELARPIFRALRQLRDEVQGRWGADTLPHLSMGMTDDFEVAVEEGATMVRIGRAIFGERSPRG